MQSRLRAARKRLGLTQEDLGLRAGVPQSSVQRAEASQHVPTADHGRGCTALWGSASTTCWLT
jgi:transcriptional regulator with XRE-family HTH domain